MIWSVAAGGLPPFAVIFLHFPAFLLVPAALVGGIWGGVRAGGRPLTAALYCIPALATSLGMVAATWSYARAQSTLLLYELGWIALLAAIPGVISWFLTAWAMKRLELPDETRELLVRPSDLTGLWRLRQVASGRRCDLCDFLDVMVDGDEVRCPKCGHRRSLAKLKEELAATAPLGGSGTSAP